MPTKNPITIITTKCGKWLFTAVVLFSSLMPVSAGMITDEGLAPYEICALCHSLDGNSPMAKFPKLAGQPPLYIEKQVKDFLTQKRTNDGGQMSAIVTEIDPATIGEIADWFAAQQAPPPAEDVAGNKQAGKALFAKYNCQTCHRGVGQQAPHIPYLKAQHEAYLVKQMRDYKSGARANDLGKLMQNLMARIQDDEIKDIAAYLASEQR